MPFTAHGRLPPPPTAIPRAHWITGSTCHLLTQRATGRRALNQLGRSLGLHACATAFRAWTAATPSCARALAPPNQFHLYTPVALLTNHVIVAAWVHSYAKPIAVAIRRDKRAHMLHLATKAKKRRRCLRHTHSISHCA